MIKLVPELISGGVYDSSLVYKNEKKTKVRTVPSFEFEYIMEDGGTSYIDDSAYAIRKNNIICAKPGQRRYSELPFKALFLHFDVEDEQLAENLRAVPDVFTPANHKEFYDLFTRTIVHFTSKEETDASLIADIFRLTALLLREKNNKILTNTRTSRSKKITIDAIKYIKENLSNNITVNDVANHIHLSKIYFHNIFLDTMGITPHRYILEKRLALAKTMLITTDKSCSDIATECGFSSQSYFNYVFKREYNVSPRTYVKNMLLDWEK